MGEFLALTSVDLWIMQVALVDLAIVVAMLAGLRYLSGLVANVDSGEMLATHDNFAFGIAFAGGILALATMLTGVLAGDVAPSLVEEILLMLGYGILGLLLIKVGRLFQDKIVLPGLKIQEEIRNGNLATAFVDLGNTLAIGVVLRAVMLWVEDTHVMGLVFVILAFVVSQLVMTLASRYRVLVYSRRHEGGKLEEALHGGNLALGIRYGGHLLGIGLAVTATSGIIAYNPTQPVVTFVAWGLGIVVMAALLSGLAVLARIVILAGVDVVQEVDREQNVGVAAVEAVIYIAIGLFLAGLFG